MGLVALTGISGNQNATSVDIAGYLGDGRSNSLVSREDGDNDGEGSVEEHFEGWKIGFGGEKVLLDEWIGL